MKRAFILLSAFILIAGMAWATGVEEEPTPAGTGTAGGNSWEIDTSPVTLSIYLDITVDPVGSWNDSQQIQRLMVEDTGVDLEWIAATDNSQTMLNILIASGDYPDMYYVGGNTPSMVELAQAGLLHKLNELGADYAPGFMPFMEREYPSALLASRLEFDSMDIYKANLYTIPKSRFNDPLVAKNLAGVMIIQEIYEELGSPALETGEDLLSVLRMVKARYPDITPAHPYRYNSIDSFGSPTLISANYSNAGIAGGVTEQNGEYKLFYEDPKLLELLKLVNAMYDEGLVNQDVFTEGQTELRQRLYSGNVFMQMSQDADNLGQFQGTLDQGYADGLMPEYSWVMIEPWTLDSSVTFGSDSLGGGVGYGAGTTGLAVSTTTNHEDRAIQQIDYFVSDYFQKLMMFGIEGTHFTINDQDHPEFTDLGWQLSFDPERNKTVGLGWLWWMRQDWYKRVKDYYIAQSQYPAMADAMVLAGGFYEDLSEFGGVTNFPPDSDELKIFALVKEAYSNAVIDIIVGPPSAVTSGYNDMIDELKRLGLDTLNEYVAGFQDERVSRFATYSAGLSLPR